MVKKVILLMAAMAFLAFSCTVTEVAVPNVTTLDAISLNPNTASSRAAIMDRDSLQNSSGFIVYADTATTATTTTWFISGGKHVYNATNGWGFTPNAIAWPFIYPVAFLAYYPDDAASLVITNVTDVLTPTSTSIELDIEIPRLKSEQEDVLVARDTAMGKPPLGELPLTFKHILSKVNFTVSTADKNGAITSDPDYKAFVLALGFCNLTKEGVFEATDDTWTLGSVIDSFSYFNDFDTISGTVYIEKEFVNATRASFALGADSSLMLLPQYPDEWDINSGVIIQPQPNEAYIRLLYRVETADTLNFIGFKDASEHLGYTGSAVDNDGYTDELYIMVGFAYDSEWLSGKGYTYNIPLPGTGGGIYLDEFYYNYYGKRTDLRIPGAVLYGHVFGDNISLPADVDDWIDEPSTDVKE